MIKRAAGARPASGDWEFGYFPEPPEADYSGCVECHRTGAVRDYVFTRIDAVGWIDTLSVPR